MIVNKTDFIFVKYSVNTYLNDILETSYREYCNQLYINLNIQPVDETFKNQDVT